jgi:hypothetical protein
MFCSTEREKMDSKTLAAAAKVPLLTLNSWISRGVIPGMETGNKGVAREFDLNTAILIGVVAELGRLGVGAPAAVFFAQYYLNQPEAWKRLLLYRDPPPENVTLLKFDDNYKPYAADPDYVRGVLEHLGGWPWMAVFDDDAELPAMIKKLGAPTSYAVVNLERIRQIMHSAEAGWEAQPRKNRGPGRRRASTDSTPEQNQTSPLNGADIGSR